MLRRAVLALTLAATASGCWMFSSLGDFPAPSDGGQGHHDASLDASRDAGVDSARDAAGQDTGSRDATAAGDARADADASDSGPTIVPAFYVSTTGASGNPGTLAAPFATLHEAQVAMQGSTTIKTTYVRAGSYTFPADAGIGLSLNSKDDGETWSYYPPDGVDSADFSGGATPDGGTGLAQGINVGASGITINGLSLHDFQYAAIDSGGGDDNLLVENNVIFNIYSPTGANSAAISSYAGVEIAILHNVIHDIAHFGISLTSAGGSISDLKVSGNVIYNTCTANSDCGAIYVEDSTAASSGIQWTNNYIHDGNTAATLDSGKGSALYAASCLSNLTVSGNVITGRNGSNTVFIQGGNYVHVVGNLTDLATFGQAILAFATFSTSGCTTTSMVENEYAHNIIIGEGGGSGYTQILGSPQTPPTIQDNDYFSYGASPITFNGAYTDSSPEKEDPKLSGWAYQMASGSLVVGSPVSFPPLVGGWGPPGYVLPEIGTPPSCPH